LTCKNSRRKSADQCEVGAAAKKKECLEGGTEIVIRSIQAKLLAAILIGTMAIGVPGPAGADEDPFDGKWHFTLTPYLWLPAFNGTLTYQNPTGSGGSLSATAEPSNYLESLDFAAMLAGEVRKGDALIFTDYIYLHLGGHDAAVKSVTSPGGRVEVPINQGGSWSIVSNVWTLAGGFAVLHGPEGFLDLFGGVRLLNVSSSVSWDFSAPTASLSKSGSASQTDDIWAAIVGLKGEVRLGESKWFVPYYADIGGSSSNWTWQAALGAGYRFGWGDTLLLVRSLSYNVNDKLDLRMTGPMLGVTFRF
jgi:hypothetical protein